jgi:spermidine synthase
MPLWFSELASPGHRLEWKINRMLFSGQSPFQTIEILDTDSFGPSLVLDGIMQTTSGDEFIYHEMLAWVPLRSHPRPRRVLIVGGGDGGLAREVLASQDVEDVTLVEIDPMVVEAAKKHLPHHAAAFADPRLTVVIANGMEYLADAAVGRRFDVILVDSTDPEGTGPGSVLYTEAFHRRVFAALADDGLFIQQTGTPTYNPEVLQSTSAGIQAVFPICRVFWCVVPTYPGGLFTFTSGSKQHDLMRFTPAPVAHARWYTPAVHRAAFALPPIVGQLVPDSVQSAQSVPL